MTLRAELVAPCGTTCGVCMRHLYLSTKADSAQKEGKPLCIGCRPRKKVCALLKKNCEWLRKEKIQFCFECPTFPCARLETLNKRYTTRYNTSLIDNLLQIRREGLEKFLETEAEKHKCLVCGGTVSIHNNKCYNCGAIRREKKK
jgi:hypothetical protein